MDIKCEKCGSYYVKKGKLLEEYGLRFLPYEQNNKIFLKSSNVTAYACLDCGAIFNLEIENIGNIK